MKPREKDTRRTTSVIKDCATCKRMRVIETAHPVAFKETEMLMKRKEILRMADEIVCNDRDKQYGNPEDNFSKIARFWSTYLETALDTTDVAAMMILLKIARISSGVQKDDNWIDIAGYAACGAEAQSGDGVTVR